MDCGDAWLDDGAELSDVSDLPDVSDVDTVQVVEPETAPGEDGCGPSAEDTDGWDSGDPGAAAPAVAHSLQAVPPPVGLVPIAWDAHGDVTHVRSTSVVAPPVETVTMGGNGTLPAPVAADPTHVTLGYVPQQVPRTDGLGPSPDTSRITDPVFWAQRAELQQSAHDTIMSTLTGVTADRPTGLFYGAGRPFGTFGEALSEERHPRG